MHAAAPSSAMLLLLVLLLMQQVYPLLLVSGAQEPKLVRMDPKTPTPTISIKKTVHTTKQGTSGIQGQPTAQLQPLTRPASGSASGVKTSSTDAAGRDFMFSGDCLQATACLVSPGSRYQLCVQPSECWQGHVIERLHETRRKAAWVLRQYMAVHWV